MTCSPRLAAASIGAAVLLTAAAALAQVTFSRVITQPGLGPIELAHVHAVADLNGDGRDDILAGGLFEYDAYASSTLTPEDRFVKSTLHVFVGMGDGSFEHAPELIEGTIAVRSPIVVADDFNSDGRADLAVFDEGAYVFAERQGYGNPPQLFLSSPDGRLRPSDALADAVRREHELRPPPGGLSGPADLHLKSATSGDIDGDGDIDLWVESNGGANVVSHIMVNNGDGTFTIEPARVSDEVLRNPPDYRQYVGNHFVDLDNDGDLELVLGQLSPGPLGLGAPTIVLVNDGTGHYPTRIDLPRPAFNAGYTRVTWLTHFEVNADGFQDLLLVHRRLYEGPTDEIPDTGRYIQVLINRGGTSFGDETTTWMGDQSATTPERDPEGNELINDGAPRMHDIDRDGCADLVMSRSNNVRTESPLVYRNDGSGRFRAMSPVPFAGSDRYFGGDAVPADVNGDTVVDFVFPQHDNGPDGEYDTADDFTVFMTLLNTTPAGSVRCGPPDLVVQSLRTNPRTLAAGAVFTLAARVRNVGTGMAAATTLRYFHWRSSTREWVVVGSGSVRSLPQSDVSPEAIRLTAPSSAGTHYFNACVGYVAGESARQNCSGSLRVTVTGGEGESAPDLVVQSLQTNPPAPAAGELFTLSATVRNVGGGTAAATTLRYYYWRSSTREWVVVGSDSVGGLAPSAASPQSMRLRYSRAGTYYVQSAR